MKKNKRTNIIFIALITILLSMTLGYATLQEQLFIYGESMIDAEDYKIVIKSIYPKITSSTTGGSGYQNATPTFENTEGAVYSVLPELSSSIIYEITIKNIGLSKAILDHIFVGQDNELMKYKIGGINTGDIVLPGETKKVTLEIEYWDNITEITTDTVAVLFNFEFLQYSDSYSNECTLAWDGTSSAKPIVRNIYGTDYYQISNANELAWFSNSVNSGTNNINAILTNDICLNSKTFTQIGTTTTYSGIFDGQNRTIKDYSFTQDTSQKANYTSYAGLFRNNQGEIKNTNLTINISDAIGYKPPTLGGNHTVTAYVGGLVTNNSGKIINSQVTGNITNSYRLTANCSIARPNGYYYIGALAGQNSGIITGSINKAKIEVNNTLESTLCNYSKYEHLYIGGIAGQNTGYISDAYNNANLSTHVSINHKNTEYWGYIGGLLGQSTAGTVKDSYSVGAITHTTDVEESDGDTIIDTLSGCDIGSNASTISNVYYENTCSHASAGTAASSADMKDPNLDVEQFLGTYFRTDITNINNSYPVLKWQTK